MVRSFEVVNFVFTSSQVVKTVHLDIHMGTFPYTPGADLGNCVGGGGRVRVNKGKALDRGTKFRAGGGYGRGVEEN